MNSFTFLLQEVSRVEPVSNTSPVGGSNFFVVYQVYDNAGNVSRVQTREVKLYSRAPVMTMVGESLIYLNDYSAYNANGAVSAVDAFDLPLDVSHNFVQPTSDGSVDITYTATDAAGNVSSEIQTVVFDTSSPTVSINVYDVSSGDLKNESSYDVVIDLSDNLMSDFSAFKEEHVNCTNGVLSSFSLVGNIVTAVFTPSNDGNCIISVPEGSLLDNAGNGNVKAEFGFIHDSNPPYVSNITMKDEAGAFVVSGGTVSTGHVTVTVTLDDSVTKNFNSLLNSLETVTINDGSILVDNYSVSGEQMNFTVDVSSEGEYNISINNLIDTAGNVNTEAYSLSFTYMKDFVTISSIGPSANSNLVLGENVYYLEKDATSLALDLVFDMSVNDISASLITVNGLSDDSYTLTTSASDDKTGSITLISNNNFGAGDYKIIIPSGAVTASNSVAVNKTSSEFEFSVTTSVPGVSIESNTINDGDHINFKDVIVNVELTNVSDMSSESSRLVPSHIDTTNCSINHFIDNGDDTYSFVVHATSNGICTVTIQNDVFESYAGHKNQSASFSFTFDDVAPVVSLTTSPYRLKIGDTYNENTDVSFGDHTSSNVSSTGELSNDTVISDSGEVGGKTHFVIYQSMDQAGNVSLVQMREVKIYSRLPKLSIGDGTLIYVNDVNYDVANAVSAYDAFDLSLTVSSSLTTLTTDGSYDVSYSATDAAGNQSSVTRTIVLDTVSPSVSIDVSGVSNGNYTKLETYDVSMTVTDSIISDFSSIFMKEHVTCLNGELSNFSVTGSHATATFTPTQDGLCSIQVGAGAFSDLAGNGNTASNAVQFTHDMTNTVIQNVSVKDEQEENVDNGGTIITGKLSVQVTLFDNITTDFSTLLGNNTSVIGSTGTMDISGYEVSGNNLSFNLEVQEEGDYKFSIDNIFDEAGNKNGVVSEFNFTYEIPLPNILDLSSNTVITSLSGIKYITESNSNITFEIECDKDISSVDTSKLSMSHSANGNVSLDISENVVSEQNKKSLTVTPTSAFTNGTYTFVLGVGAITDVDGKQNQESSSYVFKYVTDVPKVDSIASPTIASGTFINYKDVVLNVVLDNMADVELNKLTADKLSLSNCTVTQFIDNNNDTYSFVVNASNDGECVVTVPAETFVNYSGFKNSAASFSFTYDSTKPVITGNMQPYNLAQAASYGHQDNIGVTEVNEYSLTISSVDIVPTTVPSNEEGKSYIVVYQAQDVAGNLSKILHRTVNFYSRSPIMTMVGESTVLTNSNYVDVKPIAVDAFNLSDDVSVSSNINSLDLNTSGNHTVTYTATDKVGQTSTLTRTLEVNNDTPIVVITPTELEQYGKTYNNHTHTQNTNSKFEIKLQNEKLSSDLNVSSLELTNCEVVTFSKSDDSTYYLEVNPKSEGACVIKLKQGGFHDQYGNAYATSNDDKYSFVYDITRPSCAITTPSSNLSGDEYTNEQVIDFKLRMTDAMTMRFDDSGNELVLIEMIQTDNCDVSLNSASWSSNGKVLSFKVENKNNGRCKVFVTENTFTDMAMNLNTASNIYEYIYDDEKPRFIGTGYNTTTNIYQDYYLGIGDTYNALSGIEVQDDHDLDLDITLQTTNDTGNNVVLSNTEIAAGGDSARFSIVYSLVDDAENEEVAKASRHVYVYANYPVIDIADTTRLVSGRYIFNSGNYVTPSAVVTDSLGIEHNATSNDYAKPELVVDDADVSANKTVDGEYTVTYTGTDKAGNQTDASINIIIDNTRPVPSVSVVGVQHGSFKKNSSYNVIIDISDAVTTDFNTFMNEHDISVQNGTLSGFDISGSRATVTFIPASEGLCRIWVPENSFTDEARNNNVASNVFEFTYDITAPRVVSMNSVDVQMDAHTNKSSINVEIVLDDATTDFAGLFTVDTLSVNKGLSNFNVSNSVVSVTINTSVNSANPGDSYVLSINQFSDKAGNQYVVTNNNTFKFIYDNIAPTITFAENPYTVAIGETYDAASGVTYGDNLSLVSELVKSNTNVYGSHMLHTLCLTIATNLVPHSMFLTLQLTRLVMRLL